MGSDNSQGELCSSIYSNMFADLCAFYPRESNNFRRDLRTFKRRFLAEGLPFITVTLPMLGKALDYALERGYFTCPMGWEVQPSGRTPRFLGSLFNRLFDCSGDLVHYDVDALRCLRQVLYLCYKLELPYSGSLTRDFLDNFVRTDDSIDNDRDYSSTTWGEQSRKIVDRVLSSFDFKEIVPRHGPGAVATRERGDEKWTFSRLYRHIHSVYPYYDYYVVGLEHLRDSASDYMGMARVDSGCARVVLVPKDSRGPRLISCEPLEYQYIQQGQMRSLVPHLERCAITAGVLNFTEQKHNQNLARKSSIDQSYCTLDLKDASDLVSTSLVKYLFGEKYRFVEATRSSSTELPDGRILHMKKFAPMGSAMCFPVEALCFWAICVGSISEFTGWDVRRIARDVFVYGDDIIVKDEYYGVVVRALSEAGLRVNLQKSFSSGFFRESCGVDAFRGADVTPIRIRTLWSGTPEDGSALASYCSTAAMFKAAGYEATAEGLYTAIEELYGLLPFGTSRAGYPCRVVDSIDQALAAFSTRKYGPKIRWRASLQRYEVRAKRVTKLHSLTNLDGWKRLQRNLLTSPRNPEQVVGSAPLKIRTGWMLVS